MSESEDKSQDAALTKKAPVSEHEKENNNNKDTSTTVNNDKVREILGQSRMTPEERERKRKELIEKQKEARQRAEEARSRISNEGSVNAADNNAQPTQPRENLILQAVKFLSSPQVRNSDEDKKIKFLLGKGLTRSEIDSALARVDKEQSLSTSNISPQMDSVIMEQPLPPPVPSRTYKTVVARTPLWKHLMLILLITGAFSAAMIAVIKKFLGPTITAIIFAKQQLYSHQLNLFRRLNETLSTILYLRSSTKPSQQSSVNDDDDESPIPYEIDEISTLPTLLAPLATDLSELTEKLGHQQSLAKYDTTPDLQFSLTSLATYLSSSISSIYSISTSNDRESSVAQVRSEIRSLKGWLISRRNFPKIPPVPAYSAQLQSQQSQQNEDVE